MMKSMTDCINCDDAKVASAAFVCAFLSLCQQREDERPREPQRREAL